MYYHITPVNSTQYPDWRPIHKVEGGEVYYYNHEENWTRLNSLQGDVYRLYTQDVYVREMSEDEEGKFNKHMLVDKLKR
jgi:hypothetical protein